jgi:ABC-type Fe3+/spermidine/putrescine transport system ATPase subunit
VVSGEREVSAYVRLDGLSKRFGTHVAVEAVSLEVPRGDLLALLGPSGSGKTTTLRLLAGFETPDAGRIVVDGEDVTSTPPAARRFGMVFQHYALFPHLDVGRNVAFGLESLGVPAPERIRRVAEALELVELAGSERRPISALSGGQQQRVALARAIAPAPRVLLLDEPLSNLDPALRERTRRELRGLIRRIGITTILVTHEQEEAFDLADRIALLRAGRLEQVGTPESLYQAPASAFVAGFIGRASVVSVEVVSHDSGHTRVRLPGASEPWDLPHNGKLTGVCRLLVRPEGLRLSPASSPALLGEVAHRRFLGADTLYTVRIAGDATLEVFGAPDAAAIGSRVGLTPTGLGLHLFCEDPK